MFGRENLKTYTSSELYYKSADEFKIGEAFLKEEADAVMDAMENRIKELEKTKNGILTRNVELIGENAQLTMKIKELEAVISNEAKWIPVYYDLPEYGQTVRVRTINSNREVKEGTASFQDGGDWGRSYWSKHGDTVGRITHWMPLTPTTEESSATEKEKREVEQ